MQLCISKKKKKTTTRLYVPVLCTCFLDLSRTDLATTHLKEEKLFVRILFPFIKPWNIASYSACVYDFFVSIDVKLLTTSNILQLMDT